MVFPTLEANSSNKAFLQQQQQQQTGRCSYQGTFQFHETDGLVRIDDEDEEEDNINNNNDSIEPSSMGVDARLKGLASIAQNHSQSTTVITTASSADRLQIVRLSAHAPAQFWQLDISAVNIVHVKCVCAFQGSESDQLQDYNNNDDEIWTLMLVDADGIVMIVHMSDAEGRWIPQNSLNVISIPEILRKQQSHQHNANAMISNWGLTTERVAILDTKRILLATATQGLISVDWTTEQIHFWSRNVQPPPSSTTVLGFIFGNSSTSNKHNIIDPADVLLPVVSLTVADNDSTTVLSLHEQGHLYQWSIAPSVIYPHAICTIPLDHFPLDAQDTAWSDDSAPTTLTAHVYSTSASEKNTCCVAVFVPHCSLPSSTITTTHSWTSQQHSDKTSDYEDDLSTPTVGPRLLVAASPVGGTITGESVSQSLILPEEPCTLVGARWVDDTTTTTNSSMTPNDGLPRLHAWIARPEMAATSLLQYGAIVASASNNNDVVQKKPVIGLDDEGSVDYLTQQEKWIIEQWTALPLEQEAPSDMEALVPTVDQSFLRLLFRPATCRGVGHSLPPRSVHIRSALQKCFPTLSSSIHQDDARLPIQVLHAMHLWKKSAMKRSSTTSSRATSFSKTTTSSDHNGDIHASFTSARSLYESVQQQQRQQPAAEDDKDEHMMQAPMDAEWSLEDLQDYEAMWRQLLLQIWQEEEADRLPLAFGHGWIVRTGTIAQLQSTQSSPPAEMDCAARKVIVWLEENADTAVQIQMLEQQLWASFSVPALGQGNRASSVMTETARNVMAAMSAIAQQGLVVISRNELASLEASLNGNIDELAKNIQRVNQGITVTDTIQQLGATGTMDGSSALTLQQRLAASGLCARRLDAARQLFLGRFLVLSGLQAREKIREAAWLGYLRAISLLVASSNHVPMVRPAIASSVSDVGDELSHTRKRLSLDNGKQQSILLSTGIRDKTTAVDAFLVAVFEGMKTGNTPLDSTIDSAMKYMFGTQGTTMCPFPELRFIAPFGKHVAQPAMEEPKLALILHAPFLVVDSTSMLQEERLESTAKCLLSLYRNYPSSIADGLLDRVFSILHFDPHNLQEGYSRAKGILGITSQKAVDHIFHAIRKVQEVYSEEYLSNDHNFSSLVSHLFHKSLLTRDWDKALFACKQISSRQVRTDMLQNLSKSMVENGALARLISICSSHGQKEYEFVRGIDLYAIACESLSKAGSRDLYYLRAKKSDELTDRLTDYQGALYALHVSRNEWRKAAEAMDLRFVNARRALASDLVGEDEGVVKRRTQLILEDLVLAATGGYNALCKVKKPELQFIISGEYGKLPKLPPSKDDDDDDDSVEINHKRPRGSPMQDVSMEKESKTDQLRLDRYKNIDDSQTRALVAAGVYKLWLDGSITKSLAEQFLSEEKDPSGTIQVLIRELIRSGHYDHGLTIALHLKDTMPGRVGGSGVFQETVYYLTCDHLVPIVLYGPGHSTCQSTPTFEQLKAALDGTVDKPPVLAGPAPKQNESPEESSIRFAAMALLESITTQYTTGEVPVAKQVAQCIMLEHRSCVEVLPQWLSSLLTVGQEGPTDSPGLFAKRNKAGQNSFMGDPAALLEIYMLSGAYHLACELVSSVLTIPDRTKTAASRLPEKGFVEFIPYNKVDMLYNLIDAALAKEDTGSLPDAHMRDKVRASRDNMVTALEKHFDLLRLSEAGMGSARALAHP